MALTKNLKRTGRAAQGHDDINDPSSDSRTPEEMTASYIKIYRDAMKQELKRAAQYHQNGQKIQHHRSVQFAWNFRQAIHKLQQGVSSAEWWDELQEGSDTSTKSQLRDAGFGEGGVL